MKFVKQSSTLHLTKIDFGSDKLPLRHGKLLPTTIRCLVCGPSNCGKTNVVVGLILHPNGLNFHNWKERCYTFDICIGEVLCLILFNEGRNK